jgi:hypothetical protein
MPKVIFRTMQTASGTAPGVAGATTVLQEASGLRPAAASLHASKQRPLRRLSDTELRRVGRLRSQLPEPVELTPARPHVDRWALNFDQPRSVNTGISGLEGDPDAGASVNPDGWATFSNIGHLGICNLPAGQPQKLLYEFYLSLSQVKHAYRFQFTAPPAAAQTIEFVPDESAELVVAALLLEPDAKRTSVRVRELSEPPKQGFPFFWDFQLVRIRLLE